MTLESDPTEESLRRVFLQGFAARDPAEPLASFDVSAEIDTVREFMVNRPLRVVGVRVNGLITGYVLQDELDERSFTEQTRDFDHAVVIAGSVSFQEVVTRLNQFPFLVVTAIGQPTGLIVRDDLEKAPMRMWLFGMVTLVEMRITRVVRESYPNDSWMAQVSESRLEKARQLQQERERCNRSVDLIDCLQLGDKG